MGVGLAVVRVTGEGPAATGTICAYRRNVRRTFVRFLVDKWRDNGTSTSANSVGSRQMDRCFLLLGLCICRKSCSDWASYM